MENKKSFVLYSDLMDIVNDLSDEQAGKLIKIIVDYVNDRNPEVEDQLLKIAFLPIKNQLKRDLKKWEDIKVKRSESGKLGGRPKKQTKAKKANGLFEKQTKAKKAVNVNVSVNDNVNVNVIGIEERKIEFKNELSTHYQNGLIDKIDAKEFFEYWTEHGKKDRKMRFEKEKSYNMERRISTWLKNKKNFEKEKSSGKKEKLNATQRVMGSDYEEIKEIIMNGSHKPEYKKISGE